MEVSDQLYAPAALPPGREPAGGWVGTWVGTQSRYGRGGEKNPLTASTQPSHYTDLNTD